MILHIATVNKFMVPFISLINNEFPDQDHEFWLSGARKLKSTPIERRKNIHFDKDTLGDRALSLIKLFLLMNRAEKIILHGLNRRVLNVLLVNPHLLKKCYWVIRGGDLYQYQSPKPKVSQKIKELKRSFIIKRLGHIVTYIPGDVELARKWYGATGKYHECLIYISNVVDFDIVPESPKIQNPDSKIKILLGNSADPSNNHIEALERLLPYKEHDIKIYCPLSYGDQSYAQKVIDSGHNHFGDKFVPLTSFLAFDKYVEFLKSIDIAIFNHHRQQAMGNTITLLAMGKRVFLRSDVTQWKMLENLGFTLGDSADITLRPFDNSKIYENSRIARENFSRRTLVRQLTKIFEE
ncbi:4-alpha-L-fucosyltransferase glycosyl transferase group 56 [Marinobacter persicus]|uniref:4-alpha-L-fucosyltransferase glycosyl transferase group 56 n=1 Tax=Marinobacter persicus TaxID=930118 RepID=A0A1I3XAS5_9GAMM|nr:TDP-N-acetylfucosamine:lipid II N-acetylfucosaminyltransferase [Marinobacter persicus]GHD48886.1 hypothetical protein GCM10008110_18160 [Marinobacter persicus]SFK16141.1 4-alpha-L-fucosyltransferase glycosyl transferase group 56 [Marinobacter persicus]